MARSPQTTAWVLGPRSARAWRTALVAPKTTGSPATMFDADGDVLALCSTRARAHLLKREVAVVRLGRGRWTLDTALIEGASLVRLRPAT